MQANEIPIPKLWPQMIRKAMIHAISLAYSAIACSRAKAIDSWDPSIRLKGKLDQAENEISLLREQMKLIRKRFRKLPSHKRPYYGPDDRLEILTTRGWNNRQTALEFMIDEGTVANWMKQLDCDNTTLFKENPPINKYPDFVQHLTQKFKTLVPACGKKTIAEYFARAGANLCATTVGRYIKKAPINPPEPEGPNDKTKLKKKLPVKKITSCYPNHTWMLDLTPVSISGGFWSSIFPFSFPQKWPYFWWVAVIIDHFSRRVVGFALFKQNPKSEDLTNVLGNALKRTEHRPKYIISDKGSQFYPSNPKADRKKHNYHQWCKQNGIKPRFGAVGKYGSIAIIERFILSMKTECFYKLPIIPIQESAVKKELALYITWYNCYRPHQTLDARTPEEVYSNSPPEIKQYDMPNSKLPELELYISYLEGRKHLPVIEISEKAA